MTFISKDSHNIKFIYTIIEYMVFNFFKERILTSDVLIINLELTFL